MDHKAYTTLWDIICGYVPAHCLNVAAELGIADHLAKGPKDAEELARLTGARPEPLYRVLRLLAAHGVFYEEENRRFSTTPTSELLRTDAVNSFSPVARFMNLELQAACELMAAVKDGDLPFDRRFGQSIFEYFTERPELVELMNGVMAGVGAPETQAVLDACDWADINVFADIGGGHGEALLNTLRRYPSMQGVLFDLPEVVEVSAKGIAESDVADRCDVVGGDFFKAVPVEADAFFLRHILHDWTDNECVSILRNIATGCRPGTRILIAEAIIETANEPDPGKMMDISMLLLTTGKERTADEYDDLLKAAGFQMSKVTPTDSMVSVVEGRLTG